MTDTKGLVIVHTGEGKGKTTAALGLALRAWGDGLRVLILQFIKGGQKYGEYFAAEMLSKAEGKGRLVIRQGGKGFTQKAADQAEHRAAAKKTLAAAKEEMLSGEWDMIILDEINYAVKFELIDKEEVLALLGERPKNLHLVLTGRDAPQEIIDAADLVTCMQEIKHPFKRGVKAQKGIEY